MTDRLRGRRQFDLTDSGRVLRVTAEEWTEQYAYDHLGNITDARTTAPGGDDSAVGERTYTGTLMRSAGRNHYDYDRRSRVVRRVQRTLSGKRLEWHYSWNEQNQLTRVVTPARGTWTYHYDPYGRRTAKRRIDPADGTVLDEYRFAWDDVRLAEQVHTDAQGTQRSVTWDWAPGDWRPLSQTERVRRAVVNRADGPDRGDDPDHADPAAAAEQAEYDELFFAIVTDLVGTASELVTPDGRIAWAARTDLWGRRLPPAPDAPPDHGHCPLGQPGQYHDAESGLDYNYFRYYDPATGRYLTGDPLGRAAGPNPHGYVPNPLVWIDPFGLARKPKVRTLPQGEGGWHKSLSPSNFQIPSNRAGIPYEINHMPAQATYKDILNLGTDAPYGPAIRMEYDDHRNFVSTGSSAAGAVWRATQRTMISQGKFTEALQMDIDQIRSDYGTKYDGAIAEMINSLPNNTKLQDALKANGWTIRYCALH